MEDEEACNVGLGLGIGLGEYMPMREKQKNKRVICLDLSFPLHPKVEAIDAEYKTDGSSTRTIEEGEGQASRISFSHNNNNIINNNNNINNDGSDKNCSRKKLRLTKEQSTLLEDSFKQHSTLNTAQKQVLAEKLDLRPRQVEVWFQNRRARTKLKQTEVDCEFLKKCCESLSDENQRLKKELQELRALKLDQQSPSLYIHLPKTATLTTCPSCEKLLKAGGSQSNNNAAAEAAGEDSIHKSCKAKSGFDGAI